MSILLKSFTICHGVTLLNVNPNWCTVLYARFLDPEKFIFTCKYFRTVLNHRRVFCIIYIVNSFPCDVFSKSSSFATGFGLAFFCLDHTEYLSFLYLADFVAQLYFLLISLHSPYPIQEALAMNC